MPPAATRQTEGKSIRKLYHDLGSSEENVRILTAQRLIKALSKFQTSHHPSETLRGVYSDKDATIAYHHDVTSALEKLLKGLTSSRDHERQGFTLTLTHLLRQPYMLIADVSWLLKKLVELTDVKATKGTDKEMRFGRLFGIIAFVESGTLSRSSASGAKDMVALLFENRKDASYLDEVTARVVGNALKSRKFLEGWIVTTLMSNKVETAFDLHVLLCTRGWNSVHPENWDHETSVLSAENRDRLLSLLKPTAKKFPRVNIVWELIVERLRQLPKDSSYGPISFFEQAVQCKLRQMAPQLTFSNLSWKMAC